MDLKRTLELKNLSEKHQNIVNNIDLDNANKFVKEMLDLIIKKYGFDIVYNEVLSDSPISPINTHITHIIEVGSLKIISENNLDIKNKEEFIRIIVVVATVLDCSISIELRKLKIYNEYNDFYFNEDAIYIIIKRIVKHATNGLNFIDGFEQYSNLMLAQNLSTKLL